MCEKIFPIFSLVCSFVLFAEGYPFSGGSVREISIKTGSAEYASSDCGADIEICDAQGNCCKTSNLDNLGDDRRGGLTDVYTDQTILGSCQHEVGKLMPFDTNLPFSSQGRSAR